MLSQFFMNKTSESYALSNGGYKQPNGQTGTIVVLTVNSLILVPSSGYFTVSGWWCLVRLNGDNSMKVAAHPNDAGRERNEGEKFRLC